MVWGRFASSGPGHLVIIEGTINSKVYANIVQENVRAAVHDLKLEKRWVMQQDNEPKHTSKSTKEVSKKKKICVLEWSSPDLNPTDMLWQT